MCSRPFETRSFAQLARCFPHSFAFYVAFPKTLHSLTRDVFHVADPISSIETQSLPSLLHYYPRSFTFYLGNPFPRLQGDDVARSWRVIEGFSVGLVIPDLWQQEAVRALQQGKDVVVQAPTGSGKTYIFELLYPNLKA